MLYFESLCICPTYDVVLDSFVDFLTVTGRIIPNYCSCNCLECASTVPFCTARCGILLFWQCQRTDQQLCPKGRRACAAAAQTSSLSNLRSRGWPCSHRTGSRHHPAH